MLENLVNMTEFKVAGSVNDFEPPTFLQTATIFQVGRRKGIPNILILELWAIAIVLIDEYVYAFPFSIAPTRLLVLQLVS